MKVLAVCLLVAAAQAPARVPMIVGNDSLKVLVQVDGSIKTWGHADRIGLGDGTKPDGTRIPVPLGLAGVRDIAAASVGAAHVLLLARDGTVRAWGRNDQCQLGNGSDKDVYAPAPVSGLRNVKQIAAAGSASAAVLADGTVWMWGDGRDGLMANGLSGFRTPCTKVPTKVEGLDRITEIAFDDETALAVRDDGTVWGWGKNGMGGLCDGTTEPRLRPVRAQGITTAAHVDIGGNSIVVLADGTVRMCGKDVDGELADVAHKEHFTPFKVPGLTTVRSARTARGTTIVQLADGTLRAWGNGYYGALGDGHGDASSARPRAPIGLGPVLAHYMTPDNESYAIRADGTVMVWCMPAPKGEKTEFILTPRAANFSVKVE